MKTIICGAVLGLALSSGAPALAQESGMSVSAVRVLANDPVVTAAFYEKAFGMSETGRPVDTPAFKEILLGFGSTPEKANASKSASIVIATKRDKAAPVPSMAALILEVPDMDKAIAAVTGAGGTGGKPGQNGSLTYCMVKDNDGNPVELLLAQPKGAKPAAKAAAKPAP